MLSTLKLKELLNHVFSRYSDSLEVYVDNDFSLYSEKPKFYLYSATDIDLPTIMFSINNFYKEVAHVYYDNKWPSELFDNKKLIWRKGKWYI